MIDQTTMRTAIDELKQADGAVSDAAIVSYDGLVMVASHDDRDDADTLAAISSELIAKGRLAVTELNQGDLHSELVLGTQGGVIVRAINDEMVLVAQIATTANVGRVFGTMNKIAARIGEGF